MPDPNAIPARHIAGAVDLSSLVDRHQRGPAAATPSSAGAVPGQADPRSVAGAPGAPSDAEGLPGPGEPIANLPDVVVEGDPADLEQFAQLSQFVPVLVEMHAAWSSDAQALAPTLAKLVRELGGRMVLLRLDLDAHPSAGRQPQVLALLGGRPLQLFSGSVPEPELRQLLAEVLQVAAQQGVQNTVTVDGEGSGDAASAAAPAPEEPQLPAHLVPAYDALERRDFQGAVAEFERVLAERPADEESRTGLAHAKLLGRLDGKTLPEIRQRAASNPDDLDAQLDVADLDLSGGHVEDAFDRLLSIFPTRSAEEKTLVRERIVELFRVVGDDDPRVLKARQRLASLLF